MYYLSPVREYLSVSTVCNEFLWELSHMRIQVVHDHVHDGRSLTGSRRVLVDWVRPTWNKEWHIQFPSKFVFYHHCQNSF